MDFDVTMFQRIYTTQNLDGFVTIRNLRSLANDYTKKFQVLVDFMKIHVNFIPLKKRKFKLTNHFILFYRKNIS